MLINSKINYEAIIQYSYNAYSMLIENIEEFGSSIEVMPLIFSQKESKEKRTYPLLINCIELSNLSIPKLYPEENEPTFLYFNKNLNKINLIYSVKNRSLNPIIVSFFIKEKVKFQINILNGEENIINRVIDYRENILISPVSLSESYNITITIEPTQTNVNSTMIVKIIEDHSSPSSLKKDELYFGFIPKNISYLYYYVEVFNEEKGEVVLFNKRQNGILISKIINKGETIPSIGEFPDYEKYKNSPQELLNFNEYDQKLSYNSSDTKKCVKGCYLLISYYSNSSGDLNIIGSEFSLLNRILDKEEMKCEILNVPLNEYVFGSIKNGSFNVQYYSVYIPEDTDYISIEIQGENIKACAQKGIQKFNTMELSEDTKLLGDSLKTREIIELNKDMFNLETLKGKYITIGFQPASNKRALSFYYFRILQSSKEYMIYPLDTNKINLCEPKNINGNNNTCYFLLKNEYKELLNNIMIYGSGKGSISYMAFYLNDTDYYSIDLKNLKSLQKIEEKNSYLNLEPLDVKYILLEIKSNSNEYLTVLSNFQEALLQSIDIYSYQLKSIPSNIKVIFNFNFTLESKKQYRVFINNINGNGYIYFEENWYFDKQRFYLNEKTIYSFSITDNVTNIYIDSKNNLIFSIKLSNQFTNNAMEELNYGTYLKTINPKEDKFPLIYFIKDTRYFGLDINFFFNFNNSSPNNNITIKGYELSYETMNNIDNKNFFEKIDMKSEFKGFYNNIFTYGTIRFDNNTYKETYDNEANDKYYIILIENAIPIIEDFKLEINSISKYKKGFLLPLNKYIINSFDLLKEKSITEKYYFENLQNNTNKYILEYSSNYKNIDIQFNQISPAETKKIGGVVQYTIYLNKNVNTSQHIFEIKIESNTKGNDLKYANIILKYYPINNKGEAELDNFFQKTSKLEPIINETEKKQKYNLIIKNTNDIKNLNSENKYKLYYFLSLIKKKNILDNEILNTIAPISSPLKYLNRYNTSDVNKDLPFILEDLEINEIYIVSLFVKVEDNNNQTEKYYSFSFEITPPTIKENWFLKNKILIISCSGFILIVIIIVILSIVICNRIKKKNKVLEEKIHSISFAAGVADEIEKEENNSNSKNDKDYEYTFI